MKKVKEQLKTIAKTLVSLTDQVDKITKHIETLSQTKAKVKTAAKPSKKASSKKASSKKTNKKKTAPKKTATNNQVTTVIDNVFDVIRKSRNSTTLAKIREKTNLESRQISNALYKLSKKEKIKSKGRGIYSKA